MHTHTYRETTREFLEACPPVVDRIMSCFALGLGWGEDYFKEVHASMTSLVLYLAVLSMSQQAMLHQCDLPPDMS